VGVRTSVGSAGLTEILNGMQKASLRRSGELASAAARCRPRWRAADSPLTRVFDAQTDPRPDPPPFRGREETADAASVSINSNGAL
jgi:hypothetical protein